MDAVKFIEERNRMCAAQDHCASCPATDCECSALEDMVVDTGIVTIVEEWSSAHPRKTRQSIFLEQYPDTKLDKLGVIQICPMYISATRRDSNGECTTPEMMCMDCRRWFWTQEVE